MTDDAIYHRNAKCYSNTCLSLPYSLKKQAKELGINMTQTLVDALEKKMKEGNTGEHAATRPKPPASPSSTDKQVDV